MRRKAYALGALGHASITLQNKDNPFLLRLAHPIHGVSARSKMSDLTRKSKLNTWSKVALAHIFACQHPVTILTTVEVFFRD